MAEAAIRFEGVTKRFGEVEALRGLDLEVRPGEVFGFLGPNGAGKTTAIRILFDLIRPASGRVELLGHDAQTDAVELRRHATYLPSDAQFHDDLTAGGYLEFVAAARGAPRGDRARREELLRRLDLDPRRRIRDLSRGNRQKVGLVGALMTRPRVVVLDEPTTGLDPLVQETVEALLREAAGEGTTVFFSSHVLAEVEQLCTRVAMLRRGRVVDVIDLAERRLVAPQRVLVTFAEAPAPGDLEEIAGVSLLSLAGTQAEFEALDGIDGLVKRLARHTVLRLETRAPSLEEMFLGYYQEEDAHVAAG